ncbi:hypothetical protein ACX6XY_16390 [Streptomyces sp. O3]
MAEQRNSAVGLEDDAGRPPLPPELPDIDLRTLRAMDDAGLAAAVEEVLERAGQLAEVWYSTSSGGGR